MVDLSWPMIKILQEIANQLEPGVTYERLYLWDRPKTKIHCGTHLGKDDIVGVVAAVGEVEADRVTYRKKKKKKKPVTAPTVQQGSPGAPSLAVPKAEGSSKKKKPQGSGIQQPKAISPELQEFFGTGSKMARTQVVKNLNAYIKTNNLQNPENGQEIFLDDRMYKVFGCRSFTFFIMQKYISAHISPFKPVDLQSNNTTTKPKKRKNASSSNKNSNANKKKR